MSQMRITIWVGAYQSYCDVCGEESKVSELTFTAPFAVWIYAKLLTHCRSNNSLSTEIFQAVVCDECVDEIKSRYTVIDRSDGILSYKRSN